MVQRKHLRPPVPSFSLPPPWCPLPCCLRSRALPGPLFSLRNKAKWEVMTGKGIQAKQAVEPQEALSVWEPGSEARQAAQRTRLGRLAGGRRGCWQPGGALPQPGSSVQPPARSRAPGHPGSSGDAAGSSGGDVSMAPEPGNASSRVLCGAGRRGGKGGGNLAGGQAAVSTCLLPAPLSQNRFGQSEVQEGGWNNGSPMPRRGSEGPQTDILKMGEALLFLPGDRQVTPSSGASQM